MARKIAYNNNKDGKGWTRNKKKDKNDDIQINIKFDKTTKTTSSKKNSSSSKDLTDQGKNTAKGKANKKQSKREYYTLTGEISIVPGKQSIKIKAGDTVQVKGIGKYLSGKYYVQDVTRKIDQNGYSQSMTLLKPNFRKTIKKLKTKKKKKGGKKKK